MVYLKAVTALLLTLSIVGLAGSSVLSGILINNKVNYNNLDFEFQQLHDSFTTLETAFSSLQINYTSLEGNY